MAVKESSASKIKFKGVDALFGLSEEQECVREIPLDELDTFKNHPFKVFRDDKMEEMIESISEYGVLVPGIARPSNSGEKDYELVVGHRRKYACRELGLKTMPVIIRDMDLAFGILEENENNPARVSDIQKYVNRQYESCSKKKFMKVLETLVHAMGNDEGFIGDMYACNKKARNYYLDEMIQSFNFVFDEMCHGTGSAANCDFDVEE